MHGQDTPRGVEGTLLSSPRRFQPSGFLSVPWREDWRLPGTPGPTRALRPPLLGASGLSLGINSLHLEGRRWLCCAVCKTREDRTNPGNHLSTWRGDSGAQRVFHPQAGLLEPSSAVPNHLRALLGGSQVTSEAMFPFKMNNGLLAMGVLDA